MALTRKERIGLMAARRAALEVKAAQSDLDGKAPAVHGHAISDVSGLQTALDGKQPVGSYLTGITSGMVTTALGFTPANKAGDTFSGPVTFSGGITQGFTISAQGGSEGGQFNLAKPETSSLVANVAVDVVGNSVRIFEDGGTARGVYVDLTANSSGVGSRILTDTTLTSGNVTTALGFTPYNATNPAGYISDITSGMVTTALGYTPYNSSNPAGYISGITSGMVTTALGYTPANKAGDTFTGTVKIPDLVVSGSLPVFSSGLFQYHQFQSPHVAFIKKTGGFNWYWRRNDTGLYGGANEVEDMSLNEAGTLSVRSDMRAPLFYDSNDTGYYIDGNGTSRLNALNVSSLYSFGNVTAEGDMVVGNGKTSSYIYMADTDEGQRTIHCNSNRIGFLRQDGGWGAWCEDDGSWGTDAACNATIFYDRNNTAYYLNPNGTSALADLNTYGLYAGRVGIGSDVNTMNDTGSISVRGDANNAAVISFHRTGAYAINMGLGTDAVFRIGGWSASSNCFQMDGSGNLTMLGNVTAYSDARLKKDVETISGALDMVSAMRGVRYTRIDSGQRHVGVIAQEMQEIVPEVVQQGIGDDDTLSVAYGNLVGVLIEAVKELRAEVEALKSKGNPQ